MRLVHRLANIHKLYYDINKVEVEGIQHTEKQVVKESIVGFYRHIYSKSEGWSACVENPPLLSLNKTNVVWLEREFTIKEILETLHDMDGDKALGLDGFTIAFFKHGWNTVEGDAPQVFQEGFNHCKCKKPFNVTF